MTIVGVTGSICMGKSFACRKFAEYGASVFNADREAHIILCELSGEIEKKFPDAVVNGIVNRKKLADIVYKNENSIKKLEDIIHPVILDRANEFIRKNARRKFVVLDIPLLFETGMDSLCDITVVVYASKFIQKQRALKRGIPEEIFNKINNLQMPSCKKMKKADFIINTGGSKRNVVNAIIELLEVSYK